VKRVVVSSFVAGMIAGTVMLTVPVAAVVHSAGGDPHPRAFDGTVPSLTLSPLRFIIGASIDAAGSPLGDPCEQDPWNYRVPVRMHWSGGDGGSGLAGYDVWQFWEGDSKVLSDTQETSYDFLGSNYLSDCGGGAHNATYHVVATDNRGNSAATADAALMYLDVWQEDGTTVGYAPPLPVVKVGDWSAPSCACSNGGATYSSTTRGDSLTYTLKANAPSLTVGLVVGENADRGQVGISVDGVKAVPVDTYDPAENDRVIVWQRTLTRGVHTLKLTNLGTAGRSRIDIDSILLTRGPRI